MILGLSNDIKVKVSSEKDCLQSLSVEMPVSTVHEKLERAWEAIRNKVKLPGFRPGKAPIDVVKEKFKEAAYEEAQELLLRQGVTEALKVKKLNPVQPPTVTAAEFNPDKPFHFEFQVEVAPSFKLAGHKGIKVSKTLRPVTDADLAKSLEGLANMNARLVESKDETLTSKHYAVINYEGFIDGKPLDGAKQDNFLMDMSAPQSIAGLAEGLTGARSGESREVPVTFPADSPAKELAGKQAVFKVNLVAIKEKSVPAVDDEFAKDLGVESVDVLKTKLRESLQRERDQASRAEVEKQIVDQLLEQNSFPVPPTLARQQAEYILERQRERLGQQGFAKEDMDKVLEGFKAEAQKLGEREVRLAYILNRVAHDENISVTDGEIEARISAVLQRAQPQERAALEKALKGSYRDRIQSEVRDSKLFAWLIDHAKVKEIQEEKK